MYEHDPAFDFDLICLGGGNAGLAAAATAAELGAKVLLLDRTHPITSLESPDGTWLGLGGTGINAGCEAKKFMHSAAELAASAVDDAPMFGLSVTAVDGQGRCDWCKMINRTSDLCQLNSSRIQESLEHLGVTIVRAIGTFVDAKTLEWDGGAGRARGKFIVVATGSRPTTLNIPGGDLAIVSDHLFVRPTPPGATVVIGGGVVATELAGLIGTLGYPCTVLVHSGLLVGPGFDVECVQFVRNYMTQLSNVTFIEGALTSKLEREGDKIRCHYSLVNSAETDQSLLVDTVLSCVGRTVSTHNLNLEVTGVKLNEKGLIEVDENSETNVPGIFAAGDVRSPGISLASTANSAGRNIAHYLFGQTKPTLRLTNLPTCIATPIEYGHVGLSEAEARSKYGHLVRVFRRTAKPLAWLLPVKNRGETLTKLICHEDGDELLIDGVHFVGPDAAEPIQIFDAILHTTRFSKESLDKSELIWPCMAQNFINMRADGK